MHLLPENIETQDVALDKERVDSDSDCDIDEADIVQILSHENIPEVDVNDICEMCKIKEPVTTTAKI